MLSERTDVLVGSMLGKDYRVLERIGVGGMAVVYLVEHQTLLKRFAAKVLSSELASSLEARARFTQEAHAASQLDHENIVSISDFGVTADQRPYFVMELLRGTTLDRRLAEGRMTIEEVVAVCVPVARALAHAHAEGIVHLDVKPENIFLVQRSQGRWGVKVVDFGIAKTPLAPRMARPDETAGSPMFMAPEVCRGDEVDQRADVYSFGILLYLMMCGRLPFVADSVHRVLQMQLVQLPRPPREINSELSPELAIIVERALAKNPDDRYPSMGALLRDLEAALPKGADRLLIEAQSGTSLQATPFAGALGRRDSQRTRTPSTPPDNAGTSVITLPRAPSRRTRLPVVIGAIAIGALSGVVAWRQLVVAPTAAARARDRGAPGNPLPGPTVVAAHTTAPSAENRPATASAPAAAAPVPTSAEAAAAPPEPPAGEPTDPPASASGDDRPDDGAAIAMALATAPARGGHTAALKRPLVRIKPPLRRDPARPGKRVGLATGATGAAIAPAVGPAEATPPAAPEAGSAAAHAEPPAEREATAAVQPAPAALPASAPPPLPLPTPPPPPPSPGTLDATPSIGALDVKGSLSPAIVRRSIERTLGSLRACYRTAARAAGSTPAVDLRLSFEIDENSLATRVAASGGSLGSLASCATQVTGQIRTPEAPDVGTAQVIVVIRFRPS